MRFTVPLPRRPGSTAARPSPTATSGPAGPEPTAANGPAGASTRATTPNVFQTQGRLRLEFGPGGTQSVEGGPGDFVLIPKGVVHREGNPGTEANEAIVFRVGEGELLVNVDGP